MDRKRKYLVSILAASCALTWVVTAIHPLNRQAWILENLLPVLFVAVLSFAHRRIRLSIPSYLCIAIFLMLHLVGAHYTYAQMPLGLWAKDHWNLSRNYYDRFAHAAFGFLLVFPVGELLVRFAHLHRRWSLWLAAAIILAVSGLFEIVEMIIAEFIAPGKGVDWLGGQGDEWDAQNDMLCAFVGVLFMVATIWLGEHRRNSK